MDPRSLVDSSSEISSFPSLSLSTSKYRFAGKSPCSENFIMSSMLTAPVLAPNSKNLENPSSLSASISSTLSSRLFQPMSANIYIGILSSSCGLSFSMSIFTSFAVLAFTSRPEIGEYVWPILANIRRRKSNISVVVATVDLGLRMLTFCSMAMAGGMPSMSSTSGLFILPRNCRAYDDRLSAKRRWPSA